MRNLARFARRVIDATRQVDRVTETAKVNEPHPQRQKERPEEEPDDDERNRDPVGVSIGLQPSGTNHGQFLARFGVEHRVSVGIQLGDVTRTGIEVEKEHRGRRSDDVFAEFCINRFHPVGLVVLGAFTLAVVALVIGIIGVFEIADVDRIVGIGFVFRLEFVAVVCLCLAGGVRLRRRFGCRRVRLGIDWGRGIIGVRGFLAGHAERESHQKEEHHRETGWGTKHGQSRRVFSKTGGDFDEPGDFGSKDNAAGDLKRWSDTLTGENSKEKPDFAFVLANERRLGRRITAAICAENRSDFRQTGLAWCRGNAHDDGGCIFQRGGGGRRQKMGVKREEWSGAGSNRRHRPFQGRALPTELPDQLRRNTEGSTRVDETNRTSCQDQFDAWRS